MNERDFHDRHYEADAARIQGGALFTRVHDRAVRRFLRDSEVGSRARILSLGCGDGSIERRLARNVGEVLGVDLSPVAIQQAKQAARDEGLVNASFIVSQTTVPALADLGKFDCVVAFAFLHHLADAQIGETLQQVRRALRPGGCFYSSDPSRRRLVRLFARWVQEAYTRHHSPDERELDPEAIAAAASRAGFVPAIGYADYFLGPLAWLAPGTPVALAPLLEALDNIALQVPGLRRYASSFTVLARLRP